MKSRDVAPYWGIRARADPGSNIALRAALFATRMPQRAFYIGRTAAAVHDLPLPPRFSGETTLHVGVPAGSRRMDALGVTPHHVRIDPRHIVALPSFRVTSVARTWCDLASSQLTLSELVAAGDRALWRRSPLVSLHELTMCVEAYEGRRGSRLMRTALAMLSDSSDSAPESEVRVAVVAAGFPPPMVNAEIRTEKGDTYHPDLSWPEHRVAIDYEGDHHRVDRDQWNRDILRFRAFRDDNWRIYRATAEDYRTPHPILIWLAQNLPSDTPTPNTKARPYPYSGS